MHRPYPGELRMRVIDFVEEGDRDVERPNSSRSAPVLRFVGCNAFAMMEPANPCGAEEALRHWRNIRGRSSP